MGRFLLEVQPFTLLYTIFQEDTPIAFRLLLTNVTPLVKKFTSLLPAVNSRSFNWIKTRTVFQLALLGLKQTQMYRFPYPFIYLVPQKRYLFRAELPPIGHHGEYPPGGFKQYTLLLCCGCSSYLCSAFLLVGNRDELFTVVFLTLKIIDNNFDFIKGSSRENLIFLSSQGVSPFLARGDFHARSCFARSPMPEEKRGTTRSLAHWALDAWALESGKSHWCPDMLSGHLLFFFWKITLVQSFYKGCFSVEQSYGVLFSRLQNLIAPC